jgi:AAA domain
VTDRSRFDDWWDKYHPKPEPHLRPVNGTNGHAAPPGSAHAYATKALNDELAALAAAREGSRNVQLNESAFNLAQLCAAGHLDRENTWTALYHTAESIGLSGSEATATLRSAFRAGGLLPRRVTNAELPVAPPVTVLQVNGTPPAEDPEDDDEEDAPPGVRDRFPALDWHQLWDAEDEEEWVVEPILPARRLVALYSAPKVGKSLLMLELAVAIARGTAVLGYQPDRPRRVLYVDFENDPRGDIRTRLQAMGRTPDELAELVYLSYPRLPFLDTFMGGLELLAICREYDVEVVVIDTISRAVGGEENENDTWLSFYKHTGLSLKAEGIAVIRLDHTGKDPTKGMRGGSAKYGDVDAVWSMTAVTEDKLQLECTANRLPITNKLLVVKRETHPRLRHVIDGGGSPAAWMARAHECATQLDRLRVPEDAGRDLCHDALRAERLYPSGAGPGAFTKSEVERAIDERQNRPHVVARQADPLPYEED